MNQSLIRAALKIGAGYFIAKGFTDDSTAETIISGLVALFAVIWGVLHRDAAPPTNKLGLLLALALPALLFTGCVQVNPAHVAGDRFTPAYIADTNAIANTVSTVSTVASTAAPVVATLYPPAAPAVAIASPFIPVAGGIFGTLLGFISAIWATKKSKTAAANEAAATTK